MGLEWVVLYCRLCQLDRIVSAGSGNSGFYALAGYCLDGMDGLDGVWVGRGWDGRTFAPAGTGEPPWAPEKERQRWLLRGGDGPAEYYLDGTNGLDGEWVERG